MVGVVSGDQELGTLSLSASGLVQRETQTRVRWREQVKCMDTSSRLVAFYWTVELAVVGPKVDVSGRHVAS